MSAYSKDLGPGMPRKNVEAYLRAKAIPFQKAAEVDLVKIGQEAAPWFCGEVNVYVGFDFEAVESHSRAWEPYATDVLKKAHIYSRAGLHLRRRLLSQMLHGTSLYRKDRKLISVQEWTESQVRKFVGICLVR
jgi:hypothetical protein